MLLETIWPGLLMIGVGIALSIAVASVKCDRTMALAKRKVHKAKIQGR